ncbi:MAG TPA: hypothetical protein ENJ82_08155 [Bacteroidetes bacterium]|nr:hypothetical protein [Bacteroidota bacterium]
MKLKSFVLFVLLVPALLFMAQGCDKCDVSGTLDISASKQYLKITYIQDSSGKNFASEIWRQSQVSVLWNGNGGDGQFLPVTEDISDGAIGPIPFTVDPQAAKIGELHSYRYIIRKDTFGNDTVDIKFYPAVDECHEFWSLIEYSINGVPQAGFSGAEICEIEIRE